MSFKRKHEISKERLKARIEALRSQISLSRELNEVKEMDDNILQEMQLNFLFYGTSEEIKSIRNMISFRKTGNTKEFVDALYKFDVLVRDNLRKELGLEKLNQNELENT